MSLARHAKRTDTTQAAIVEALRKCGYAVYCIGFPVDLLIWRADIGLRALECKTPKNKRGEPRLDKRQAAQRAFVELTGTKYVTTPEEALEALR